jgi:hypothetical protein
VPGAVINGGEIREILLFWTLPMTFLLEMLTVFPDLGPPVYGKPDVRRILHSPFYVYYRVHRVRKVIEAIHFGHTSPAVAVLVGLTHPHLFVACAAGER